VDAGRGRRDSALAGRRRSKPGPLGRRATSTSASTSAGAGTRPRSCPAALRPARVRAGDQGQEGQALALAARALGKPKILTRRATAPRSAHEDVIAAVLRFKEQGYRILGVVFDRNAEGEKVAQELENEHGIEVIEHSQDPAPMADASMGFGTALGEGLVEHPTTTSTLAHVLAAKAKTTTGENWRIVAPEQNRGQRKQGQQDGDEVEYVDAAIATVMPTTSPPRPSPRSPTFDLAAYRIERL
jgi:hypothetical protein